MKSIDYTKTEKGVKERTEIYSKDVQKDQNPCKDKNQTLENIFDKELKTNSYKLS